jgi:hypothetical protein
MSKFEQIEERLKLALLQFAREMDAAGESIGSYSGEIILEAGEVKVTSRQVFKAQKVAKNDDKLGD